MRRPSSVARSRSPAVARRPSTASLTRSASGFVLQKHLDGFVEPASAKGPYLDKSQATIVNRIRRARRAAHRPSGHRPRGPTRLASARPHSCNEVIRPAAMNEGHTGWPSAYYPTPTSPPSRTSERSSPHNSRRLKNVWSSVRSENTWTKSLFFMRTCTRNSKGCPECAEAILLGGSLVRKRPRWRWCRLLAVAPPRRCEIRRTSSACGGGRCAAPGARVAAGVVLGGRGAAFSCCGRSSYVARPRPRGVLRRRALPEM